MLPRCKPSDQELPLKASVPETVPAKTQREVWLRVFFLLQSEKWKMINVQIVSAASGSQTVARPSQPDADVFVPTGRGSVLDLRGKSHRKLHPVGSAQQGSSSVSEGALCVSKLQRSLVSSTPKAHGHSQEGQGLLESLKKKKKLLFLRNRGRERCS